MKKTIKEAWNNLKEKNESFSFKGLIVYPNHNRSKKRIAIKLIAAGKFQAKKTGFGKPIACKDIAIIEELNKRLKENGINDVIKKSKHPICFNNNGPRFLCIEGKIEEKISCQK